MKNELSMSDEMFNKITFETFSSLADYNYKLYKAIRQIKHSAMKGKGLKEISVMVKTIMISTSEDLINLVKDFDAHYGLKAKSISKMYENLYMRYREWYLTNRSPSSLCDHTTMDDPISQTVMRIQNILSEIEKVILFIRVSYNLNDSKDDRFNATSGKEFTHFQESLNFEYDSKTLDEIEAELKKKKIDLFSVDYGKVVCAKLRSLKSDILNSYNKTYGKNSEFAEITSKLM